jgi:hypothetical protein
MHHAVDLDDQQFPHPHHDVLGRSDGRDYRFGPLAQYAAQLLLGVRPVLSRQEGGGQDIGKAE